MLKAKFAKAKFANAEIAIDYLVVAGGGGGGAGGAIGMQPIGFLVSGNGEVKFIPTTGNSGLQGAINKLPDLVSKFMDLKMSNKKGDKG